MSPQANSNTPSTVIKRVRTRTHADGAVELHVTYADDRRVNVPANGRYESRVSYRHDRGVYRAEPVR